MHVKYLRPPNLRQLVPISNIRQLLPPSKYNNNPNNPGLQQLQMNGGGGNGVSKPGGSSHNGDGAMQGIPASQVDPTGNTTY